MITLYFSYVHISPVLYIHIFINRSSPYMYMYVLYVIVEFEGESISIPIISPFIVSTGMSYSTITVDIICHYDFEEIEYLLIEESSLFVNTLAQRSEASGYVFYQCLIYFFFSFYYFFILLVNLITDTISWAFYRMQYYWVFQQLPKEEWHKIPLLRRYQQPPHLSMSQILHHH